MKNFTLCAVSLIMAAGVSASPLKPINNLNRFPKSLGDQLAKVDAREMASLYSAEKTKPSMAELSKKEGKKVVKAASTRAASESLSTEIRDVQPAGAMSYWSKSCIGWMQFWGMVGADQITGMVQQIVDGEDGKLYMNVLFSQFPLGDIWVEAEKNDNGFTIASGQCVYMEEYDGEMTYFYLTPLTMGDYDDEIGDFTYTYHDTVEFNYIDGEYVEANPDIMLALCENDVTTDFEYLWAGYGDQDIVISPLTSTMAELPSNFETSSERWAALTDNGGYFVDVMVEGDKMYTKGLIYGIEGGAMVGTIDGDKVRFKAGSFVGMDYYWTWTYVYGGTVDQVWNEEFEMYEANVAITGDLIFKYDAEAKRIITENAIIVAGSYSDNIEEVAPTGYIEELTIELQHRNPDAAPKDPFGVSFYDEMEYLGSNTLDFYIPDVDVDGNLLDTANLYYRMYVDGDLFTFYNDEYPGISDEGETMLNSTFTNFENIWVYDTNKTIWLFFEGADEIGVQSVYLQPVEGGEPKEIVSNIVTVDTSALKKLPISETVISKWYDIAGREVKNPSNGIFLRVDKKADGTFRTSKVVK